MFSIYTKPDQTLFRTCAVKTSQSLFVPLAQNTYPLIHLVASCHLYTTVLQ